MYYIVCITKAPLIIQQYASNKRHHLFVKIAACFEIGTLFRSVGPFWLLSIVHLCVKVTAFHIIYSRIRLFYLFISQLIYLFMVFAILFGFISSIGLLILFTREEFRAERHKKKTEKQKQGNFRRKEKERESDVCKACNAENWGRKNWDNISVSCTIFYWFKISLVSFFAEKMEWTVPYWREQMKKSWNSIFKTDWIWFENWCRHSIFMGMRTKKNWIRSIEIHSAFFCWY